MKISFSQYLQKHKPLAKELVETLAKEFQYVSILGSDCKGKMYSVKKTAIEITNPLVNERGFVVRVHNGINYSEYSFNELTKANMNDILKAIRRVSKQTIDSLQKSNNVLTPYDVIPEETMVDSFYGEVILHPDDITHKEKIQKLKNILSRALAMSDELVDVRVRFESTQVSKFFISNNKDLEQSYIYSAAAIIPIASRNGITRFNFESVSDLAGVEVLDMLEDIYEKSVHDVLELLEASKIVPGEYDIICDPSMSGLIAHEAFGHGVEMDMYVKNRAKAVEYMQKCVASDLVMMHDGAKSAQEVSSYLFDDEGSLGTDTVIIENGILINGISDVLSALKLGTKPTGNGKRESFERKAYARMTNTFFKPGKDKLEDMIKSIEKGFLLEGFQSGMEDPKNWGIQCVAMKGREISKGKLTGKVFAPVYLTGYVPELLQSISMVSGDLELSGSGYCGKGHKEFVKTSTGGPFIKCRGNLS